MLPPLTQQRRVTDQRPSRRPTSSQLAALAALALVAVVACGGGGASTAPTTAANSTATPGGGVPTTTAGSGDGTTITPAPVGNPVDMCALFSAADFKTVTGDDYGDGVLDSVGQCVWRVGGTTVNIGDGQVVAFIQEVPLATFKGTFLGGVDVTVSGHAGYWNPSEGLQSIWVDVGGRTLVLSFDPVDADSQAVAQKVAEIAVANM